MTESKMKLIAYQLFHNQRDMAKKLKMANSKTAMVVNGKQKPTIEAIDILLNDYNIDPEWLFRGEDDTPIKYRNEQKAPKQYYDVIEKLSMVQEELLDYKRREAGQKGYM